MRRCSKCEKNKNESEFYKHSQMIDGLRPECKECSREYQIKYYSENKEKIIKHTNKYRRENPNIHSKSIKKYNKNNKEKRAAHVILGHAIESGKINKPYICHICGADGIIHGHHSDYTKPLEVVWVCPQCHKDIHKKIEADK